MFPEPRRFFEESDNDALDGNPVITEQCEITVNLRAPQMRDIQWRRLEARLKLRQNMRASRETELVHQFPAHVVAAWIWHSVATAEKQYL